MNDAFDIGRHRRSELDREIDTIRTERLIRSASTAVPSLPARARAGLGRGLISLGTSLVGSVEAARR